MPQDVNGLLKIVNDAGRLLIVIHDNPDPDALASAAAMQYLTNAQGSIPTQICCERVGGRAENTAIIRELRLRLTPPSRVVWSRWPVTALIDTQPSAGNNAFPHRRMPELVIDHHPLRPKTRAQFLDVRSEYGACTTILAEYLLSLSLTPASDLAAAMCYAITSETQDLVRQTSEADTQAYLRLYPLADKRMLGRILHPRRLHSHYATLARAVLCGFTYGNIIGCNLGEVENPDSVSLVADLLLRHERMGWSIVTGVWQGELYVSLRAMPGRVHAGTVLRRVLRSLGHAGGHGVMAAGKITLKTNTVGERQEIEKEVILRLIQILRRRTGVTLKPLINPDEIKDAIARTEAEPEKVDSSF